jgi:hypothetical protein
VKQDNNSYKLNNKNNRGFALPIIAGFGFLMLLVGLTIVLKSQGDEISGQSQAATSRGQGAAETGVSRFQTLINQNRVIATYPDCTTSRVSSTCPDSGTALSWSNATQISGINGSCGAGTTAATAVQAAATTNWQDVDSTNSSKGQYRLISYSYSGTPGVAGTNTKGTLTVEGRVKQSGIGSTATAASGTATTQIQVQFPVRPASPVPYAFPGLWVTSSVSTGQTDANVFAACNASPVSVSNTGYSTTLTNLTMPLPPAKPATNIATISDLSGLTLPRTGDSAYVNASTGEYQYSVSNITGTFTITPGTKVAIYLDGNISMTGGQKAILHQCPKDSNGNLLSGCNPTDVRIYGLSANGQLNLGGNASICDVFFLAPTYTVNLNGGGQAQGCSGGANNNGIYWVGAWSGGGQGNHTSLSQTTANWGDLPSYLSVPVPPQIGAVVSWQRQQAQ